MNDLGPSSPLVPPLFQSSVYCLPDLDALDRVMEGEEAGLGEGVLQAMAETDPHRMIAWAVRIPYRFVERSGDYISALVSARILRRVALISVFISRQAFR